MLLNSVYEASITLILKSDKNFTKKKKNKQPDSVKIDQLLKFSSPTGNLGKTWVRETPIQAIF